MRSIFLFLFLFSTATLVHAQWTSGRPDGHAPIGVMGDHTHGRGEFMFSYRAMHMVMDGNRDGTDAVSTADVVDPNGYNFLVSPTQMPMTMHMFGLMYAPTGRVTLMIMVPVLSIEMDHVTRSGGAFTTSASGLGDVKLAALYSLASFGNQRVLFNAGVSFPIGSIETMDVTPASAPDETQLPYPMQLGSGTVDLMPGLTYLGQTDDWSWGGQGTVVVRLGENDQEYHLGNKLQATLWGARKLSRALSVSTRLEAATWGNIEGASPSFAGAVGMRMVPTVFSDLRGGGRIDAALGLNVSPFAGTLKGLRFAIEALSPVYQDLDGPQLETDWTVISGLQYAF
jgi:hypothetical protein